MTVPVVPRDSAQLLLRMPHDLRTELKRRAAEQGVSANSLAVFLLSGALGFKLDGKS